MPVYRLPDDHVLEAIVRRLIQIASPDKIILFGSRALGTNSPTSDYDICVLKKNSRRKQLLKKIYHNGLNADAPVDILVNTPRRFDELKERRSLVYHDIAKFGKIIYEK